MKKTIFFLFLSAFTLLCKAQKPPEPQILSPNAASFVHYGNTDVNLFTGTPNISIPLHTIKEGSIEVPVTLSYHPDMVKPNNHPGWVGLGWNLNCGGVITRQVNGVPDEYVKPYVGYAKSYFTMVNDALLTESINLHDLGKYQWITCDYEADEFYFNFLGYSGKFYFTYDGRWEVISDDDIQVSFRGTGGPWGSIPGASILSEEYYSPICGFTLTTADGTDYEFGGPNLNAVELSADFSAQNIESPRLQRIDADAWYLTKITNAEGRTVTFTYERGEPICNVGFGCFGVKKYQITTMSGYDGDLVPVTPLNYGFDLDVPGAEDTDPATTVVNKYYKAGKFIFPVYLKSVSGDHESSVTFERTITSSKTYSIDYLETRDRSGLKYQTASGWLGGFENLKWYQLDRVKFCEPGFCSIFNFNYVPPTGNIEDQRLKLYSIEKMGHADYGGATLQGEQYGFEYVPLDLGEFGGGNVDYWGYYNGSDLGSGLPSDVNSMLSAIYGRKYSNYYQDRSLLKKIIYPTKGYTTFNWEANRCKWIVAKNRRSLTEVSGNYYIVGGCRVGEIKDFDINGHVRGWKAYKYENNSGVCTGVLNGMPEYKICVYNRFTPYQYESTDGLSLDYIAGKVQYEMYSYSGVTNYSSNGQSHIGYTHVKVEDLVNGGDADYTFTNFTSSDLNGVSHFDLDPPTAIGWSSTDDQYMTKMEIKSELGKTLYEQHAGAINKETSYEYDNSERAYASMRIKKNFKHNFDVYALVDLDGDNRYNPVYQKIGSTTVIFASKLYDLKGTYVLKSKTETLNGGATTKTEYEYLGQGYGVRPPGSVSPRVTAKKITRSDGTEITETYNYSEDLINYYIGFEYNGFQYSGAGSTQFKCPDFVTAMKNRHIHNLPVFTKTTVKTGGTEKITEATLIDYYGGSILKPKAYYRLNNFNLGALTIYYYSLSNTAPASDCSYDITNKFEKYIDCEYDDNHNLARVQKIHEAPVFYLWGPLTLNAYPKAKIVAGKVDLTIPADLRNSLLTSYSNPTRSEITNYLDPNDCMIYLYDQKGDMLSGETDPNGRKTTYEYDLLKRLEIIRNNEGNILKKFEYHFATP